MRVCPTYRQTRTLNFFHVEECIVRDIDVRLGNGITVETQSLGTVALDPRRVSNELTILSHAHTDHLPSRKPSEPVIASRLTGRLAAERRGWNELPVTEHPAVELFPAGHVAGSRAALITDNGRRILYTGDVCTRDRPGITGFEPVPADVLILEATYGSKEYRFPPIDSVVDEIETWLSASSTVPKILLGYSLGRSQRIIRLFEESFDIQLKTTESIRRINELIGESTGRPFSCELYDTDEPLTENEALLVTNQMARSEWVQTLIEERDANVAGFTGWALDRGYRYRRSVDIGFPLSDHCDYTVLLELVEGVDPEIVYLHHGFSTELAKGLTRRGYDARALVRGQATLDDFR